MSAPTFIAEMEQIGQEVAEWLNEQQQDVLNAMAPNGVPFGLTDKELTRPERLQDYLEHFRGNPDAQANWIRTRVQQTIQELETKGVDPAAIASVHPYEVAMNAAIYYSYKMELLMKQHEKKVGGMYG